MSLCYYHPSKPSNYHCEFCELALCGECVEHGIDSQSHAQHHCFSCGKAVSIVNQNAQDSVNFPDLNRVLHYPMSRNTGLLVFFLSLLSSVLLLNPIGIFLSLFVMLYFLSYSIACCMETAKGDFKAPSPLVAFDSKVLYVLFRFIGVSVLFFIAIGVSVIFSKSALLVGSVIYMIFSPAILIILVVSSDMLTAMNPKKIILLIRTISRPYMSLILLVAVVMFIMTALAQIFDESISFSSIFLQSLFSNYYYLVAFHCIGCLIYDNRKKLGFMDHHYAELKKTSNYEKILGKISVAMKDGDYQKVLKLYQKGLKQFPDDAVLMNDCFTFLLVTGLKEPLSQFAMLYFKFLASHQKIEAIVPYFQRVKLMVPNYLPSEPRDRLFLAEECHVRKQYRLTVELLSRVPKEFPKFSAMIRVYELLHQAFAELPGMMDKSIRCAAMVKQLKALRDNPQREVGQGKNANKPRLQRENQPVESTENLSIEELIRKRSEQQGLSESVDLDDTKA